MERYCENGCGLPGELHHITHRSTNTIMRNIKINFKYLCVHCHRLGPNAVHNNYTMDIKYKLELQDKLFDLFNDKEYFTEKEIKQRLECSVGEVRKIVKTLMIQKEGYEKQELVKRLMGNRLY